MVRLYDKSKVKGQLDTLSDFIKEHFPGHYAEHLEEISKKGIGDRACIIMMELKLKNDAMGTALIGAQTELKDSMEFSTPKGIPGPPGPMGPAGSVAPPETRSITLEESYAYADSYTPVRVHVKGAEGEGDRDVYGNIVGHIEETEGEMELDVDIGGVVHRFPLCRVFVEID